MSSLPESPDQEEQDVEYWKLQYAELEKLYALRGQKRTYWQRQTICFGIIIVMLLIYIRYS